MANRRMFNKELVSSDKFLDMPASSQALFFHLGINADDEGFVSSPKRISRSIGCADDEIKILIAKRFVISFESGVIVIIDWNKHNQLRKDRFTPTIHTMEKEQLQLIENQQLQPNGNQMTTTGKPSIEECRIVELSEEENSYTPVGAGDCKQELFLEPVDKIEKTCLTFEEFWELYDKKVGRKACEPKWKKIKEEDRARIKVHVPFYKRAEPNKKFRSNPETFINGELWHNEIISNTRETPQELARQREYQEPKRDLSKVMLN